MSSPASRWRRATRKSSGPFFPGAWPNNSAQDSIIARSVLHATKDAVDTGGGRTTQHGQAGSVAAATTSRLNDVRSPEPLQHLDHVMDFHQRLSLSLDHAQAGSTATEGDLQMHSSRTETFSGSSATTIATPSPLSPTVSMSFPSIFHSDEQHEKPFSLPHITTQHHKSSTLIHSESPAENYYNDTRISTQLDPPLSNFAQGLPPLSLPPHTLSFSPESVASYFSSSEQSRSPLDYTTSPPPRSSSISSSASATPASLTVSSPLQPEIMTLPEIPSSLGFATSFYPVIDSVDSRYGTHPQDIHGLLSPVPTNPMRGYDNDSPVLPAEEETGPSFLSPLLSPRHRGFSPSSADMDAFGLAAIQISSDARSDVSIPTSFRSHFAAGPASREAGSAEADATKPADVYRRHRSSSPSFSSSLSSVGTLSLDQRHPDFHPNLQLRRQESRSEPPLSLLDGRTGLPLETTLTSSAASVRAPVPTRFSKVKQFSGKIKKLFAFKGRSTETGAPAIGVTRSTQVTCVEYASVRCHCAGQKFS
ncbi:hypothetical protein BC835DRAFT_703680 [Cytidiella melzeri]|nr:hypothetical protein BC835DRAFT_703680 [Cytidiella melzeri]